jgi:hypothetical protein
MMAQTTPVETLPPQITLEFHQVEPLPDEGTRPIEIGENGSITSSDRLCVVEIHDMEGEPIATLRLKETSRWLAHNNYRYIAGTNGMYQRIATSWL